MPAGEPHTMLSPIEKAVLASCAQSRTSEELHADLWVEFQFDRIPPTISFLKRRQLLEVLVDDHGLVRKPTLYRQTELGARVLAAQRRKEDGADFLPERRLRAVS